MKSLLVRTGARTPRELPPALALYVWGEHGLKQSLDLAADEITAINPDALVLHAGPVELKRSLEAVVKLAHERHPGVRIWVGVGLDGTVGQWRNGTRSAANVIDPLVGVALLCERLKIEVIVWNGESEWKDAPHDQVSPAQIETISAALGVAVTDAAPSCVHALSSFAQPNYHAALSAFLRGFTRHVSIFSGQAYVAVRGGAARGSLPRTLDAAARAQELAERAGWLPDDVTTVDVATDVDRIPTVQAHQTPLPDLARAVVEMPHVLVWSVPMVTEGGRADPAGLQALRFASVVRATGMTIRQWQRAHDLTPDEIVGSNCLAAAGIQ